MTAAVTGLSTVPLVQFVAAGRLCAVDLPEVQRVVRMVALEPLPEAPPVIVGVFSLHGEIVPVASVALRLGAAARPPRTQDQLMVVRSRRRPLALLVERVDGIIQVESSRISRDRSIEGLEHLLGVTSIEDGGVLFVYDIDSFLSLDEAQQTEAALRKRR